MTRSMLQNCVTKPQEVTNNAFENFICHAHPYLGLAVPKSFLDANWTLE